MVDSLGEDDEGDAILVKRALAQAEVKHPVVHLGSGVEAMAYLSRERPYDDEEKYPPPLIVLLDIVMPRVDGFELLRWIRHQERFSRLPVAMLTGSDRIQDAQTAYGLGATSFFVKPFDFANAEELARTLKKLIAKGQTAMA